MTNNNGFQVIYEFELVDSILANYQSLIGVDYVPYRNHVIRMLNFTCALLHLDEHELKLLQIGAAFHDIGIWTANTVDYLPPSVAEADKWLEQHDYQQDRQIVLDMIEWHHKMSPIEGSQSRLPEAFRQGDLVDFSLGLVKTGLPREFVKEVKREFPNAGFHKMLMKLSLKRLLSHPFDPVPMMRR